MLFFVTMTKLRTLIKTNITKLCDHPGPSTTSHNLAVNQSQLATTSLILLPPPMTTHDLPLFQHRSPGLRTLLKNELF